MVGHVARRAGAAVLTREKARLAFARPEPFDEIVGRTRDEHRQAVRTTVLLLVGGAGLAAIGFGVGMLSGPG